MGYMSDYELRNFGFKKIGKNVKISKSAAIYEPDRISIGDNSRIDDFCIISGNVEIGRYCHITPQCLIAGGKPGVEMADFCTLAYGVRIFAQSDDYSGATMTNSTIPRDYKREIYSTVKIKEQCIVGANSCVMPGVVLEEGCAIGAMSLLLSSTEAWGIYYGVPASRKRDRMRQAYDLKLKFLAEISANDSI